VIKTGVVFAAVILLLVASGWLSFVTIEPTGRFLPPRIVSIHLGESMAAAARQLRRRGVIRSRLVFILYAELSGQAVQIKPGDYAFKGGEAMGAVLRHLVNGDFMVVTVTIPEGLTVHQIGERLEAAGLVCDNVFDRATRNGPVPRALGLGVLGAEGFLFPATYRFSPLVGANQVVSAMLQRFYSVLTPQVEQRIFQLKLDVRQLVTLASIVEKEAAVPGERRLIASVFYNRMARGMPLQSDSTAQYNFAGEIERAAIAVHASSAFNTYTIPGLPPGPIANPGLDSIMAVLYPAHSDYLYFVARNDGTHVFSRSFREHQRAIEELKRFSSNSGREGQPENNHRQRIGG
jgi:UPF0755 protein